MDVWLFSLSSKLEPSLCELQRERESTPTSTHHLLYSTYTPFDTRCTLHTFPLPPRGACRGFRNSRGS